LILKSRFIPQNAFTILFTLRNKKKIDDKDEDNNKNIKIVVINYYKMVD